jgi:ArsR family transcriptional regulator
MANIKKRTVLFLCSENSARSQMAESLLKHKAGDRFEVFSAGTNPGQVDERAVQVLGQFGVYVHNLVSKSVCDFNGKSFDYVITLCNETYTQCKSYPGAVKQLAWDLPDPKIRSGSSSFTETLNELNNRLTMFLQVEEESFRSLNVFDEVEDKMVDIQLTDFYKSLTGEIRLKTLMLTHYHGELCVCELMEALEETNQPKVSRNLAVLKKAKVITDRKHGQWVFYRINQSLPLWAKSVIAQTTENNISLIRNELQHLDNMQNRPDRTSFCK